LKRLLFDVNVILDILLDREPHAEAASALWAAVERGEARGFIPAHAVTTIHYLIQSERGNSVADTAMRTILEVLPVAPVDGTVLQGALALGWRDFEDAVCFEAARAAGCDVIVSRDGKGFAKSAIPAIDAAAALVWLSSEEPLTD
jgi:predicted nucleic acid-binding protein